MSTLDRSGDGVFRPALERAVADVKSSDTPDGLLACLLEYESCLPERLHRELHVRTAQHARVFDPRLLQLLTSSVDSLQALVMNPRLDVVNAEWLASWCVANIRPVRSISDRKFNDRRAGSLKCLVEQHGLHARGLAGQLLYNQALSGDGGQTLAREALHALLSYSDIPNGWLARLQPLWSRDDHACRCLAAYRPGARRR